MGLGVVAALLAIWGHHPWDGPVIETFEENHGLHLGDALALVPLVVGVLLARWCWRRRDAS